MSTTNFIVPFHTLDPILLARCAQSHLYIVVGNVTETPFSFIFVTVGTLLRMQSSIVSWLFLLASLLPSRASSAGVHWDQLLQPVTSTEFFSEVYGVQSAQLRVDHDLLHNNSRASLTSTGRAAQPSNATRRLAPLRTAADLTLLHRSFAAAGVLPRGLQVHSLWPFSPHTQLCSFSRPTFSLFVPTSLSVLLSVCLSSPSVIK